MFKAEKNGKQKIGWLAARNRIGKCGGWIELVTIITENRFTPVAYD